MARTLHRDITVIGGSAGGISALREMLAGLPADYPAAVFIVVHVSPEAPSVLHQILDRVCKLPVAVARSGARVRPGTVTLASPDLHLVFKDDHNLHAHKRPDPEKFFPTKIRMTLIQVSKGEKYNASLVPNLPKAAEKK